MTAFIEKTTQLKTVEDIRKLYKRTLLDDIIYYCFYIWWNWVEALPRNIKSFWQRGHRGWADSDTWNFDCYLIDVLRDGLRYLQQSNSGIPTEIYKKYQNKKDLTIEEKDRLAINEWNLILEKMIEGFDSAYALVEYFGDVNEEERARLERARQKGFDLFKKYFFNLWS